MSERNTDWVKFFKDCGIPSSLAAKYAVTFSNHRIQMNMLRDLNKEILYDMGIKTMGDVIAILRHAKDVDEEAEKVQILGRHLPASKPAISTTPAPAALSRAPTAQAKRPLIIDQKEETVNKKLTITPTQQQAASSVEYMSRGSTYVIKMPNFATPAPVTQKAAIFSRLGGTAATSTPNINIAKAKITAPGSAAPTNSSSVFARLGRNDFSAQSPASPPNTISRNKISSNQSILRGAEGSTMFTGKATATVKPTNLLVRKSINESQQFTTFRPNVKNRIGISNNQFIEKVNVMRSANQSKTLTTITAQQLKTVTQKRGQTISLKKSVFDRLGPV